MTTPSKFKKAKVVAKMLQVIVIIISKCCQ